MRKLIPISFVPSGVIVTMATETFSPILLTLSDDINLYYAQLTVPLSDFHYTCTNLEYSLPQSWRE